MVPPDSPLTFPAPLPEELLSRSSPGSPTEPYVPVLRARSQALGQAGAQADETGLCLERPQPRTPNRSGRCVRLAGVCGSEAVPGSRGERRRSGQGGFSGGAPMRGSVQSVGTWGNGEDVQVQSMSAACKGAAALRLPAIRPTPRPRPFNGTLCVHTSFPRGPNVETARNRKTPRFGLRQTGVFRVTGGRSAC